MLLITLLLLVSCHNDPDTMHLEKDQLHLEMLEVRLIGAPRVSTNIEPLNRKREGVGSCKL